MHLGGVSGTDVVSSVLGAGDGGDGGGGLSVVVPKPLAEIIGRALDQFVPSITPRVVRLIVRMRTNQVNTVCDWFWEKGHFHAYLKKKNYWHRRVE